MRTYFTAAPSIYEDAGAEQLDGNGGIQRQGLMVHDPEPQSPRRTGLLNARGVPIFSTETREPLGFALARTQ